MLSIIPELVEKSIRKRGVIDRRTSFLETFNSERITSVPLLEFVLVMIQKTCELKKDS